MQDFEQSKYKHLFARSIGPLVYVLIAGFCLTPLPFLTGCGKKQADDDRLTVVATTTMIEDLARVIGGEEINVVPIMRTGEDPHLYDVKPRDAIAIRDADVVLMNGLHLEATLASIVEQHATGAVVALAEQPGISPITGSNGLGVAPDPHCWMDVANFKLYAQKTCDALVAADPEHADLFRSRTAAYLRQLDELDAWVREQFETVPEQQRVIVTGHDAFAYFGRAYHVQVHGLIGISTEQDPLSQDVESLMAMVRDNGVRAVFIESSTSGNLNQLVHTVGQRTGAKVCEEPLHSDSLGDPGTPAATYIGMVRHNTTTIVQALNGQ